MTTIDLITMLGNLSQSLFAVQSLISGLSYLLGITFILNGVLKFKDLTDAQHGGGSRASIGAPVANVLGGAALLYLPSMLETLSNTAFGTSSLLQYSHYEPYRIYSSMHVLIQTAGLIWFVRGCVLLIHSTSSHGQESGANLGLKGLLFLIAGVFAMNFDATVEFVDYALNVLMTWFNRPPS